MTKGFFYDKNKNKTVLYCTLDFFVYFDVAIILILWMDMQIGVGSGEKKVDK